MDIPFVPHAFDNTRPRDSVSLLLTSLFPACEPTTVEYRVTQLSQGTTNALFKVTLGDPCEGSEERAINNDTALIKVYGDGTEITIDREKEIRFHAILSAHDLAPRLLCRFLNGHAYQFLAGNVCSADDIREKRIWRGVARELGRLHAVLPTNTDHDQGAQTNSPSGPNIWSTARKWLDAIPSATGPELDQKNILLNDFEFLKSKLLWNKGLDHSQVLGHGDLLCGNIILQDSILDAPAGDIARVKFIDYEHSTYCPRAFDLANHFSEWAGFECDYNLLPTKSTRRDFIREYLQSYREITGQRNKVAEPLQSHDVDSRETELNQLLAEVDMYRGFPGFYWGLCALIQAAAAKGSIEFDYAGYAAKRFSEYRAWREEEDGTRLAAGRDMSLREMKWEQNIEKLPYLKF
ncbi:kinase-like domain-containing protein [Nemania sp. FL0916]|nr:kinase-like domain-containing protein [Nemania sp. FL0916]